MFLLTEESQYSTFLCECVQGILSASGECTCVCVWVCVPATAACTRELPALVDDGAAARWSRAACAQRGDWPFNSRPPIRRRDAGSGPSLGTTLQRGGGAAEEQNSEGTEEEVRAEGEDRGEGEKKKRDRSQGTAEEAS